MVSAIKKRETPSISTTQIQARKPPANKSRLNLKKAKERNEDKERALALTIDKAKREQEFDCLNKMGEACTNLNTWFSRSFFLLYGSTSVTAFIYFINMKI